MSIVEYTIALPATLARDAEAAGLKMPEAVEVLLREELKRRNVERLFTTADRIADLNFSPMTEEEIQAEVDAVRKARRSHAPDA
jgi:post-segregation antitoxin (ccd killing protein)